ncbi:MAG: hypothetical protein KU37_04860 [Sulfuricurvum sp. PC08-66]|nr:MAG: hypothetical protein KU37_04860 [Sulfuricurvum sp. PC08-66]
MLVTKTDLKGRITYANREFLDIVGLSEAQMIGQPHNLIRHPDMPKVVFYYLWEFLQKGVEINAYVKNLCANGAYYWVMANVTPSFDLKGSIIGYHSARRNPEAKALEKVKELYTKLLEAEKSGGLAQSRQLMQKLLEEKGMHYDEFILSL